MLLTNNMKKLHMTMVFIISINLIANAQRIKKPHIQYVTLSDSILISELKKYINYESKMDTLFAKNRGYIEMSFSFKRRNGESNNGDRIDTVFTYYIRSSFMSLAKNSNKLGDIYPNYYSFISDRLICVSVDSGLTQQYLGFSEKSKNRLNRIVEKSLDKSRTFVNTDRVFKIHFLKSIHSDKVFDLYVSEVTTGFNKLWKE